jgi:hypothetical protein
MSICYYILSHIVDYFGGLGAMSKTVKRQLGFGIALIGSLFGFWASHGSGLLEAGFALCACGVMLWHVIKRDEVELLLSMRAAAFTLLLVVAILSTPLGFTPQIAESARLLWAFLTGSLLIFCIIFRARLG